MKAIWPEESIKYYEFSYQSS